MLVNMEFLENWNYDNPLPITTRTQNVNEKYDLFKKEIKDKNIKIEDYILDNYLNNKKYCLEPNTFPYNVPKTMSHYVFWVHPNYKNKITTLEINNIIKNKMNKLGFNEYFCFENNIACKSVLGILHFQVFFNLC